MEINPGEKPQTVTPGDDPPPPVDVHTLEITPLGSTTEHARPEMNPWVDMHTRRNLPP